MRQGSFATLRDCGGRNAFPTGKNDLILDVFVYTKTSVDIEFDAAKDAINIAKHGISLARAVDMTNAVVIADERFDEVRFRIYGQIDGHWHCAAVTMRGSIVRIISLRRARGKEVRHYV